MKKISFAALALACSGGAAFAQSSVTLYGVIDVGLGQQNGGAFEGGSGSFSEIASANAVSRWGMLGTEDLGGGLKAKFNLEAGFIPTTGAAQSNGFNRQSWVGLFGNFGQIRLGRMYSVVAQALAPYDLGGAPDTGPSYANLRIDGFLSGGAGLRQNSQIQYMSPVWSGLQVQASFISKYDTNSYTFVDGVSFPYDKNAYSFGVNYALGGFSAGAAYASRPTSAPGFNNYWGAGLKYDFGPFVVSGNYFDNAYYYDGKGYGVGFAVPYNAFYFDVQVARNIGRESKGIAWEFYGKYSLSKRTSVYALYGGLNPGAEQFIRAVKRNSWAIGLTHLF